MSNRIVTFCPRAGPSGTGTCERRRTCSCARSRARTASPTSSSKNKRADFATSPESTRSWPWSCESPFPRTRRVRSSTQQVPSTKANSHCRSHRHSNLHRCYANRPSCSTSWILRPMDRYQLTLTRKIRRNRHLRKLGRKTGRLNGPGSPLIVNRSQDCSKNI